MTPYSNRNQTVSGAYLTFTTEVADQKTLESFLENFFWYFGRCENSSVLCLFTLLSSSALVGEEGGR